MIADSQDDPQRRSQSIDGRYKRAYLSLERKSLQAEFHLRSILSPFVSAGFWVPGRSAGGDEF